MNYIKNRIKNNKKLYLLLLKVWNNLVKIRLSLTFPFRYAMALKRIKNIKKRVLNKKGKINVVFIAQHTYIWNKFDILYKKLSNNNRFNVYILCVPENNRVSNNNKIFSYLKDSYKNCINSVTVHGWYDLESLHPDYVFYGKTYNNDLPDLYKTDNVSKFALLCSAGYGSSISSNFFKIMFNSNFFKDIYCYFGFCDEEVKYLSKRFFVGKALRIQYFISGINLGLEKILNKKQEYISKSDNEVKTILWTPRWSNDDVIGGSNFINYKEFFLKLANANPHIKLVIRPHPGMFTNFISTGVMSFEEVINFKNYCKKNDVVLDENDDYIDTFFKSSLLVTDISSIIPEYYILNKPIIYCESSVKFKYNNYIQKILDTLTTINNESDFICALNNIQNNLYERDEIIREMKSKTYNSSDKIINFLLLKDVKTK